MNKNLQNKTGMIQLTASELLEVKGGGDIIEYLKCVRGAMMSGGASMRSVVLGFTIWGLSRMAGVAKGCL